MSTAILQSSFHRAHRLAALLVLALMLALAAAPAIAQQASSEAAMSAPGEEADPAALAEGSTEDTVTEVATPKMKPIPGIGMPIAAGLNVQEQFSPTGQYAEGFHHVMLWVMGVISVFVLVLLVYVMWKFRAKANPVPSRTTHNTLLEVAWTLVPVLVLVAIAIPSISLLAQQYRTPPKDAITIKATGYQWYWGYSYPDNGDFEIISNMLTEEEADAAGEPRLLAVDNRMVVPAGVPLRIQTTGADVIHSFAVPSLWFKLDAVPGRLNEKLLTIEKPGVYYGQCSELCGARHGYMPIAVEALPLDEWRAWVRAQGGTFGEEEAAPAAAPTQQPESATPNAAGAGAPPVEDDAPSTAA
ncbi:cytochrome c oxidase subunit II [Qipengyuania sp.]|uniref:cytochrome c oxidase subunit II n=1 Tax=Qipengyuania sp. TaxID=2004515 RepID=UPI0035C7D97C